MMIESQIHQILKLRIVPKKKTKFKDHQVVARSKFNKTRYLQKKDLS